MNLATSPQGKQIQMSVALHTISSPELLMFSKYREKNNGGAQPGIAAVPWGSAGTVPQKSEPSKYQKMAKISKHHYLKSLANTAPIILIFQMAFQIPALSLH